MPDAVPANRAETPVWFGAFRADAVLAAGAFMETVIKAPAISTFLFVNAVVPDFFGYSGTILAGFRSDGFETEAFIKGMLDLIS